MKYYELTYIISPDLTEEELKKLSEIITNFIQEEGGFLEKITKPSKDKLGFLDFHFSPEKLENLEKNLKAQKQIIRYIIFNKKVSKKTQIKETLIRKRKLQAATAQKPETEKVELEEIDKKIEEILKEPR